MQLKQRIKRIEEKFNLQEAVYCECDDKYTHSLVESVYHPEKNTHSLVESVYHPEKNTKVLPRPSYEKGFCDKCKKSFNPATLQFLENAQKIYGSDEIE